MREAGDRGIDLIVLSDAGMRDRTEFLLANVANRVSHAARCSVVFVAAGRLGPVTADEPRERLLGRAIEIGRVFARHGLRDDRPPADRARRLREALEELGPTFAKLGQVLSTRPDLLPPEYIAELARLQDDMPPFTQAEVVTVLEVRARRAVGGRVRAASSRARSRPARSPRCTAQRCPTARAVVLKVQRPTAERQILEDLALLELFAEKAGNRPAFGRVVDLPAVFAYLSESLRRELDFSIEAASIERIRPLLADFDRLAAPRCTSQLSTRRAARDGGGREVSSVSEAAPEEARREAARQLLSCYYQQVLGEGFFHADPHPGNLRWADGQVWFLDFGMVGELEPDVRLMLLLLVMAFWRDDAPFLAETLLMLSGPEAPADLDLERPRARPAGAAQLRQARLARGDRARPDPDRHGPHRGPPRSAHAGLAVARRQGAGAGAADGRAARPRPAAGGADRPLRGAQPHARPRSPRRSPRRALRAAEVPRALAPAVRGPRADDRARGPGPGLQVEVRGLAELERSVRRMTIAIAAAALAAAIALVARARARRDRLS